MLDGTHGCLTRSLSGTQHARAELMSWNRGHLIYHDPLQALVRSRRALFADSGSDSPG